MNIVWLTWKDLDNPLTGGAEVVNEELAARLAAAGHTVTFLTSGFPGAAATAARRGFHIVRTGSRYTNYFTAARYFRAHRTELAADLVIDECNTMPYFAGYYARTRTVSLFYMLCREIWFYEFPQPLSTIGYLLEPLYLRFLKPKSAVITISNSSKQDLARHGFKPENIHLISVGTESKPVPDLDTVAKFDAPTLLSHGSIRPMKRTLDQVKAFEIAKATMPDLRLIVSGGAGTAYGREVLAYIKNSPHAASIHYAGRTTEAAKLKLMQKCHAILVTSVKEGWGLIVTEAAGQGTPAVVYDVDGLRDSVRAGTTGLITAANTPEALAAGALELLADPVRYQKLRVAAWDWAKTITFDQTYTDFTRALGI
jgi:glycosyltransferase involved in cell wall biosynthesis